jgi:hypothetical protein
MKSRSEYEEMSLDDLVVARNESRDDLRTIEYVIRRNKDFKSLINPLIMSTLMYRVFSVLFLLCLTAWIALAVLSLINWQWYFTAPIGLGFFSLGLYFELLASKDHKQLRGLTGQYLSDK